MEMEQMDYFSEEKERIFKKAQKITLLYDAEVSIILLKSDNFYEYTSPTSSLKKLIDQYQSIVGVDIWSSHYEKMQEELRRLKDVNTTLRREIMQRKGGELDDLNMQQLGNLEEEMHLAFRIIKERKYRQIEMRIEVCKKKIKNSENMQYYLRDHLEKYEHRHGTVVDKDGYESAAAFAGRVGRPNPALPRIDEGENSCVTTAAAMEIEDSD